MEIWDVYDENRRLTGRTMIRGDKIAPGDYHLVVDMLFLNSKGETLLQRRAKDKDILPDIWSVTGGSALRGEDSRAACIRENTEELGFAPDLAQGRILFSESMPGRGCHRDVYLIFQDMPVSAMRFQPEEVQDAQWIYPENILRDAVLWRQMLNLRFWEQIFPYLCLESMRIRIPRGIYRHYKGNRYQVEGLCLHSETLEPMVIYRALYGAGETWVRPASMWNERVQKDGESVPRFAWEAAE